MPDRIIAGRSGSGSLANIPVSRLQSLGDDLAMLSAAYDRVVLDLGAGVDRTVRQFSSNAGICVVITTDEPTALTDAYAFVKTLRRVGALALKATASSMIPMIGTVRAWDNL